MSDLLCYCVVVRTTRLWSEVLLCTRELPQALQAMDVFLRFTPQAAATLYLSDDDGHRAVIHADRDRWRVERHLPPCEARPQSAPPAVPPRGAHAPDQPVEIGAR